MGDSTDSEEFFDAEEFTPIKGSKRSSLNKLTSATDPDTKVMEKVQKTDTAIPSTSLSPPAFETQTSTEADRAIVKSVVQDRRRFQELRRCMQTDDDEMPEPLLTDHHSLTTEQPFKIIAHDTMSLQSMTSLGRIGRLLAGAAESHPNILESSSAGPAMVRAPSTHSDDPLPDDRTLNVLAMAEPDVIASTKANSLKHARSPPVDSAPALAPPALPTPAPPAPRAPPRRKKRNKLYGSQSLSTTDGDNLSLCSRDTDELRQSSFAAPANRPPPLRALLTEQSLSNVSGSQSMALPSPASTIESLTREFQDSLELSQSKYERMSDRLSSTASSRSSAGPRVRLHDDGRDASLPRDTIMSSGRANSDARPTHSGNHSMTRSLESENGSRSRRRSAGDEHISLVANRSRSSQPKLTDQEILDQVEVLNLDTGERMPLSAAEHQLPQCINPLSLHIMRLTAQYLPGDERPASDVSPEPEPVSTWRTILSRKMSISTFNLSRKRESKLSAVSEQNILQVQVPNRETDDENESQCGGGPEDDVKEEKQESTDKPAATIKRKTEKCVSIDNSDIVLSTEDPGDTHKNMTETTQKHEITNHRLKRFFGSTVKKTVDAAKSLAAEVSHARHKEDVGDIADDVRGEVIKLKASTSHKGPYDFDQCLTHVQEMDSAHSGPVWCCKPSLCGRLLATAGQDKLLRVWVTRDAYPMLHDMRTKYNSSSKSSPTPSQESLSSLAPPPSPEAAPPPPSAPYCPKPFCVYSGHTSDVLDVSWSRNWFLLSSSMDKTVRLWHVSRAECLCCFQHIDFVTALAFHPRDDRYFLSGSLDGKLRLWDIPEKKVAVWNEVDGKTKLITAANFCQGGKFAVAGTYDGRCIFYTTDRLKYHTQIDVRSTRGKNSTGRKISGIEPMPNDDKILITSNDSRIRLYDLRDLNLSCKYKGYVNVSSQIKASFSHDGKYIVSGSENQCIYIWKTYHDYSKFTSVRRDRNDFWEGIKAHNAVVTCAVFAPNPDHVIRTIAEREQREQQREQQAAQGESPAAAAAAAAAEGAPGGMVSSAAAGHVLVSADYAGCVKVFVHRARPKHSSLPASALV